MYQRFPVENVKNGGFQSNFLLSVMLLNLRNSLKILTKLKPRLFWPMYAPNLSGEQRVDGVEPLVELLLAGRLHEEAAVLGRDAEGALGEGLHAQMRSNVNQWTLLQCSPLVRSMDVRSFRNSWLLPIRISPEPRM